MPANPLARVAAAIRSKMSGMADSDLQRRWEIGQLVGQAVATRKYGEGVVTRLAEQIGHCSTRYLYQCYQFARQFTLEELQGLLQQKLADGRPLDWAHIRALLSLGPSPQSRRLRQRCIRRTCRDSLTASELSRLVGELLRSARGIRRPLARSVALRRLARLARVAEEDVPRQVAALCEAGDPKYLEAAEDYLARALAVFWEQFERISTARASQSPQRGGGGVPPGSRNATHRR